MVNLSDSDVRDKLILLEQDFFASLTEEPQVQQSFLDSWGHFEESLASVELSSHTLGSIYTLATMIRDISAGVAELHRTSENVADQLATNITEILSKNTIRPSTDTKSSSPASYPAYIEPSCEWLLENLHNPYPSKEIRIAISTQTGCPRRYIDNWFIDARKRIGWNNLRRSHFSNKRMDIIDAATRFFVKDDPDHPLAIAIEMEFATMQARAQLLHAGKYKANPSTVVESVTTCISGQGQGVTSYPSPEPSPGPLLRTSSLPVTTVEVSVRPDRKRRNSAISFESDSAGLPSKRPRLNVDYDLTLPAWSVDVLEPPYTNKRKRRLSDGDCHGFPKRVCHDISLGPRLRTVSDPTSLDGWFRDFFEPVSVDAPDSSALLDIDVYDCARFDSQKRFPVDFDSSLSFDIFPPQFDIFLADNESNSGSDLLSFGANESLFLNSSASLPEISLNSPLFESSCVTPHQLEAGLDILPPSTNTTF